MLTKKVFTIDGFIFAFEGFSHGQYWNGWECPCFTLENAKQILEMVTKDSYVDNESFSYNEETESLHHISDGYEEIYEPKEIVFEGVTYKTYDIGSHAWVWDSIDFSDKHDLEYIKSNGVEILNLKGENLK